LKDYEVRMPSRRLQRPRRNEPAGRPTRNVAVLNIFGAYSECLQLA